MVVVVAAVASALGPRGGLALKFLEIISPLAGGGCCWRVVCSWVAVGGRLVVAVGVGGGCVFLCRWAPWRSARWSGRAGRHGVLRGGTGARWWVVVVVRRWALGFPLGG